MNVPDTVADPLIVTTFDAQLPFTPAGKPLKVAPVAPVVAYVMVVKAVLIQRVWILLPVPELSAMVLSGVTVMVPVFDILPQPHVKVIV